MAQWYQFVNPDDFEPEIRVGLYDRWLSLLGFGPTQAERVLVHTPMMDLAHERRFAMTESGQDMSDFESKHSRHIAFALDQLHPYLPPKDTPGINIAQSDNDDALIGLAPIPSMSVFRDSFPLPGKHTGVLAQGIPQALCMMEKSLAGETFDQDVQHPEICTPPPEESIIVDESPGAEEALQEEVLEALRQVNKKSRRPSFQRPRKFGLIRARRPMRCGVEVDRGSSSTKRVK